MTTLIKIKNVVSGLITILLITLAYESSSQKTTIETDLKTIPFATAEDIRQFDNIVKHQMGVAVLGGETTKPFYFDHKPDTNESIYKYKKLIDYGKIPAMVANELHPLLAKPGEIVDDVLDVARCGFLGIFGKKCKNFKPIDTWFPVEPLKQTVCGKTKHIGICTQDFIHTEVTIDQDYNIVISPTDYFSKIKYNKRTKENFETIEGEVFLNKRSNSLNPLNGRLLSIERNKDVCLYGAWMADILDVQLGRLMIADSDSKVFGKEIGRENNEIHPINQLWYKNNEETLMTAMVDGTGYFAKKDATQVEASGLNQKMSFYKAFHIPSDLLSKNITLRYQIEGTGFKFDDGQSAKTSEDDYQLKSNNSVLLEVREVKNSFKTNIVTFDQVRKRQDGSIQGYMVVETEKIRVPGGSINITLRSKPISIVSQLKSNGNDFTKMNLGAIGPFDDSQNWKSGDFNGSMRYTIYFSTNDSLRFDSKSDGLIINYNDGKWLVGDVNGDNKDDIINVYKNSANRAIVTTIFSDGNRFGDVAKTQVLEKYYDSQIWAIGDVNGDRKSDLVLVYGLSSGTTKVKVYLVADSRYDSSNDNTINIDHDLSRNPTKVLVSDFNGDEKADISLVYGGNGRTKALLVYAGENSYIGQNVKRTELVGTGFDKHQHWRAGDVNGDNKSDLIYIIPTINGNALTGVHHSSEEAFLPNSLTTVIEGSRTLNRYIRGDFNGDGKTDLINVMEFFPE